MIAELPENPIGNQPFGLSPLERLNDHPGANIKVTTHAEIGTLAAVLAAGATDLGKGVAVTEETISEEQEWIAGAKRADVSAFESLYRAHVDRVYGLCLRMTGNASEAEDCTQEAFIQAWRQLSRFRGDSSLATWLHRIAVNAVLGRMRKSRRERDRMQVVSDVYPARETVGDSSGLRDLEEAMESLPTGARHVFVLNAVYGYSHEETGEMLGIASGTSKAQLHRAKRLLAQQLNASTNES